MDPVNYNNNERIKGLGNLPASEMTKRETIATQLLPAIVTQINPQTEHGMKTCVDKAVELTDLLLKRLYQ